MGVSVRSQFIDERSTRLENNKAKGPEEHRGQTVSLRYKQENGHFRLESGKEHLNEQWRSPKAEPTHQRPGTGLSGRKSAWKMLKASVPVCGGVCPSECHRLGGLGDRNGLSHSSGGYTSKIKVSAGDAPPVGCEGESVPGLSPSLWWPRVFPALALCLHVVFSLWVSVSVSKYLLFYKDTSHTALGPPLVTSS